MTVTPEGHVRGIFLGMVLAGLPLHPDAVRLGMRLTDGQLANAFSLAAELALRCPGENFSIRRRGSGTQRRAHTLGDWSGELYFDVNAVSAGIIVIALTAEPE